MKHKLNITILLVILFLLAQFIGLFIVKGYLVDDRLPYSIERPVIEEEFSYLPILFAIIIATVLAMLLARFKARKLWKAWFFISVWFCLLIAFGAFLNEFLAFILAVVLSLYWILRQSVFIQNLTQLFIYAGLAGLFVPILNVFAMIILLLVISIYDMIAVWKTKHMIKLAKFQSSIKLFAGFMIPYGKNKEAILGGGDVGFPLLFVGVVLKEYALRNAIIVIIGVTIALFLLLIYSKKNKFYPAMPFLSLGCLAGYLISLI